MRIDPLSENGFVFGLYAIKDAKLQYAYVGIEELRHAERAIFLDEWAIPQMGGWGECKLWGSLVPMIRQRIAASIAGLLFSLSSLFAYAQVIDRETIDRTLDEQQRAQAQTVDLLASVLDVQLRQLEENGLAEHEIYRDSQLMRRHLQRLVDSDMQLVIDTLRNSQQLPLEKRDEAFKIARQQIRQIVRQLTVERQLLLQRLKIFELADQVRKLIQQQTVVRTSTSELIGNEASTEQAARILKAIEDQRDIKDLYQHLIDTLSDMKTRRGLSATIAADGLRILKVLELDGHVDSANRQLRAIQLESASEEQALIAKGLKELLKIIDRAQGTIDTENATAREIVRALLARQKELRDQAKSLTEQLTPPAELVEQQAQLQTGIARLHEHVGHHAKADAFRQQAEAAVFEAAGNLLENKVADAVANQGRVLGSLAALERAIADESPELHRDQSADELSLTVQILTKVQTALADSIQKFEDAQNESSSPSQVEIVLQLTELIKPPDEQQPWPAFVRVAFSDVVDAIATKPPVPSGSAPAINDEQRREHTALRMDRTAIQRAKTTIDRALIEARRISLAIRIGELTRSAEVLERTAAEQRSIVKDTVGLISGESTVITDLRDRTKELSERQSDVAVVASKIGAALIHMAPEPAQRIADEANRARTLNGTDFLAGALTSPDAVHNSIETALSISQRLAENAQELRAEILTTAEELARLSNAQAVRLSELRTAVETGIDQLPSDDLPIRLEQVRNELDQAIREQVRAQGRSKAADAMRIASAIQEALETQSKTDIAIDAGPRDGGAEVKSTSTQVEVAEKSHTIAQSIKKDLETIPPSEQERANGLLRLLDEAEQTASQAANRTLAGDKAAASSLRSKVRTALEKARTVAQENVAIAMAAPPNGPQDPQAQGAATKAIALAQRKAIHLSREIGEELTATMNATESASESLLAAVPASGDHQAKAFMELLRARETLNSRIQQQVVVQTDLLAQQSTSTRGVANRVDLVEPSAGAVMREAISHIDEEPAADRSPQQAAALMNRVTLGLEQAVAELGAREQEVRHDLAIAESVVESIKRQQAATSTIAEQASELERLASTAPSSAPATAQRAAAHKLNDARHRFVESQRATGQAAVELSGQIEIANPSLREALERASKFIENEQGLNPSEADNDLKQHPAGSNDQSGSPGQQDADKSPSSDANGSRENDNAGNERRDGSSSSGVPAGKNPHGLGTGFISQSPELTAEMMAGADAIHAARQALAAQLPPSQQSDSDSKSPPESSNSTEETEAQASESGRSSKLAKGNSAGGVNQKVKDGLTDQQPEGTEAKGQSSGESRQNDENDRSKTPKEDAWFAKLPPELRKSLRAGVGQKSPRAYEERLKKYFQSVD